MQYKKKYIHDRLLEEGMREFLEKGYRMGNITAIAERAEVPVGNLYRYFDGKSGLLDALVKSTYKTFPELIDKLAWTEEEQSVDIQELNEHLTQLLLNIFEQHANEMILLSEKCQGTRYEDFLEKIIDQVSNLVFIKFFGQGAKDNDRIMSKLYSKAFILNIFDVLKLGLEREKLEEIIYRLMNFYFYDIEERR